MNLNRVMTANRARLLWIAALINMAVFWHMNGRRLCAAVSLPEALSASTGIFVALDEANVCLMSVDGVAWSTSRGFRPGGNWRSRAEGGGVSVIVNCQGRLLRTGNGSNEVVVADAGTLSALHGVAYGNGRFVAVGNEGAVISSEDGLGWTVRDSGTDERLRAVIFGNGLFITVGYAGTILTSPDGLRWTRRKSGSDTRLKGIAFGDGTFVAVGWHGVVLTSQNGTKWRQQRSGSSNHLRGVMFIGGAGS